MQARLTKENMKMLIKRFLHIITELLVRDEEKEERHQYKQILSQNIV